MTDNDIDNVSLEEASYGQVKLNTSMMNVSIIGSRPKPRFSKGEKASEDYKPRRQHTVDEDDDFEVHDDHKENHEDHTGQIGRKTVENKDIFYDKSSNDPKYYSKIDSFLIGQARWVKGES